MGKVKSLLLDNDIEFIKNYLRKNKDSTCASNKCCVNSIQKKENKRKEFKMNKRRRLNSKELTD